MMMTGKTTMKFWICLMMIGVPESGVDKEIVDSNPAPSSQFSFQVNALPSPNIHKPPTLAQEILENIRTSELIKTMPLDPDDVDCEFVEGIDIAETEFDSIEKAVKTILQILKFSPTLVKVRTKHFLIFCC